MQLRPQLTLGVIITKRHPRNEQLKNCDTEMCIECGKADPPRAIDDKLKDVTWVCCDGCNNWCHAVCSGISNPTDIPMLENWLCFACDKNWDL